MRYWTVLMVAAWIAATTPARAEVPERTRHLIELNVTIFLMTSRCKIEPDFDALNIVRETSGVPPDFLDVVKGPYRTFVLRQFSETTEMFDRAGADLCGKLVRLVDGLSPPLPRLLKRAPR